LPRPGRDIAAAAPGGRLEAFAAFRTPTRSRTSWRSPITSPIAAFEGALGVCRKRHASVAEARDDVLEFLKIADIRTVGITWLDAEVALEAFARYGKGRRHPAQLNLGDCRAYEAAKNHGTSLLFKGDDFSKTDIRPAT
jgi:ribonuclease VapC